MKTYLLTLSYDGTDFHGWQRQNNLPTVQKVLEDALAEFADSPVTVTASGRTDEGVHALGQTASFSCETSGPAHKFADALNSRLPQSVRAVSCKEVLSGFCARRSAKRKTYVYRMYVSPRPLPHFERYALRLDCAPNVELMKKAAAAIGGTHDFKEFYCLGSSAKTTVRTVFSCSFELFEPRGITPAVCEFKICGDGFLYKMVRLLAGALLALNCGKLTLEDFKAAVGGEAGKVKKVPAEAKGLTLVSVEY